MATNNHIIEEAIGDLSVKDRLAEYKILLEGVLNCPLDTGTIYALFVANELWHNHTEQLRISDIAYIRTTVANVLEYEKNKEK